MNQNPLLKLIFVWDSGSLNLVITVTGIGDEDSSICASIIKVVCFRLSLAQTKFCRRE